jgi:hypothetical protein
MLGLIVEYSPFVILDLIENLLVERVSVENEILAGVYPELVEGQG